MTTPQSDAFVFFGATGDLAFKQIFPALNALVNRGGLKIPIIGMARAGWSLDKLRDRARDSLQKAGQFKEAEFEKLAAQLRYVDGDYAAPETFQKLRKELGEAGRPIHYLAIPPSMFASVVQGLAKSGSAKNARVIRREAFRPGFEVRAGARPDIARSLHGGIDFSNRSLSRQRSRAKPAVFPLRERLPRAHMESPVHQGHSDHHGRVLRRAGAGRFLRGGRSDSRCGSEPPAAGDFAVGDGCAGGPRGAGAAGGEAEAFSRDASPRSKACGARPIQGISG